MENEQKHAERLLSTGEITRLVCLITGHTPSRSSLWRWHLSGRLETTRIGGRLYATESAIRRMLAADEQRNRGSSATRGIAAAARIAPEVRKLRRSRGAA
jgi:hypothetical protein